MKKLLALSLALALAVSVAACSSAPAEESSAVPAESAAATSEPAGSEAAAEGDAAAGDITIGYATKSSSSPFWVENIRGAEDAAAELGVAIQVLGPPVENDVAGQIAVLEDMITSGADAICVAPTGSVGVADVVAEAMGQGIPVIAVGDPIEGAEITSEVTTDNYAAGEMAAAAIGEEIGGEGTVIIVNGIIAQGGGKGRRDGFVDYMAETYGDAVNVVEVAGDWDDQKALTGFEAAYAANPDMVAGYAAWDGGALQMHQVLTTAGRDDVVLCGFDAYEEVMQLMVDGDPLFQYDVAQNPYNMGYQAVMTAYDALMGEEVESYIDTGTTMVTPETAAEYSAEMGYELENV